MNTAEQHAWARLEGLDPKPDVCRRSLATLDPSSGAYVVNMFGMPVTVAPEQRTISGSGPDNDALLTKLAYFSRLSILHYLAGAADVPLSNRLVKPSELKVGQIYFRGSHVLPVEALAARYARDTAGFVKQAIRFGGEQVSYGDASVMLFPFPRLPVTLILWREDDEFPARADLLFDATCEHHVPADILWSIAMLSVKVMLLDGPDAPPCNGGPPYFPFR